MAVRDEYAYHSPTPEQLATMNELRQAFSHFHGTILGYVPECRYRSKALTALEEAALWTNKAIVLGEKGNRG